MSRADDQYDNAWAVSFWRRLKTESVISKGGYTHIDILRSILLNILMAITMLEDYIRLLTI